MSEESLHRLFDQHVYSYFYRASLFTLDEAQNVISTIQGTREPHEEFYFLRTAWGTFFLILSGIILGPIFIALYILQLVVSAVICLLAKMAEIVCLLGLKAMNAVSPYLSQASQAMNI